MTPYEKNTEQYTVTGMLAWDHFQLYLFDFDGVLVDTESLHFMAYQRMLNRRGFELNWSHQQYAQIALFKANGLREFVYQQCPGLKIQEPSWDILYQEKKKYYLELLDEVGIPLMPGVAPLLTALKEKNILSCVVTHSPKEQIERVKKEHPILNTIPHWITRECYVQPKPHPECYQHAISLYAKPGDRIVGFEDSPRGMTALIQTEATPYLVTSFLTEAQIQAFSQAAPRPFVHLPSLVDYLH